jgi:pyruvate formate lyase activating enzyme
MVGSVWRANCSSLRWARVFTYNTRGDQADELREAELMDAPACLVIDIARGTMHDGPGMRTTVFLKGCPLACAWCQNPEGMRGAQEVWWEERRCIRCLACLQSCPVGAIAEDGAALRVDRSACDVCGACVEACPALAMTFTGQAWTLDQLVREALKDKDYYEAFGGGVTVSGGEPLAQPAFVAAFFSRLKERGVHTALDTCGWAPPEALQAVLPHTDCVLFDIKLLDPEQHRRYTGRDNEVILANLLRVADAVRSAGRPSKVWIRTPLIPGATATAANLSAIGAFLRDRLLDVVERWELCAFNSACKTKYRKLDQPWAYQDCELMRQDEVDALRAAAVAAGVPDSKLVVSGLIARR